MKKKFIIILMLFTLVLTGLFADTKYYSTGDTIFSFSGGINLPGLIVFTNNKSVNAFGPKGTHLNVGGSLGLSYQAFLTNSLALGGSLSYKFNSSISSDLYVSVPIVARLSYFPIQSEKFDLSITLDAGISYFRYRDGKYVSPFAGLFISPSYYFTKAWGIGLNLGVDVNWDFYFTSSAIDKTSHNALGFFSPITVKVIYRH